LLPEESLKITLLGGAASWPVAATDCCRSTTMKLLSLVVLLTLSTCQNPSRIQAACLMDFMMTLSLHVPPNAARAADEVIE
jgi:hypothetical protein